MIYIAGDHYTIKVMNEIEAYLKNKQLPYENVGALSEQEITPLQKIIPAVAELLQKDQTSSGILVCGTGAGVEIGANRFKGIRASLCRDAKQAEYAKVYDNANLLCLGSWFENDINAILDAWFSHQFDGDEKRSQMIKDFDSWQ